MARLRQQLSHAYHTILHQPACGPSPHGANRPLVLHLERLEDRCLMNADPAVLSAASGDLDSGSTTGHCATADAPGGLQASSQSERVACHLNALPDWIVAEADRRHGSRFGTQANGLFFVDWDVPFQWAADQPLMAVPFRTMGTNSVADFSTTNVQVAGIDEADLVETDGDFLYIISGEELVIVDVRDINSPTLASRVALENRPAGMYLDGDRLTLISNQGGGWQTHADLLLNTTALLMADDWGGSYRRIPSSTEVKVLDVADATAPKLVQSTEVDGRLISSRMIDGQLRLVVQHDYASWSDLLPSLQRKEIGTDRDTGATEFRYETRSEYLTRVYHHLNESSLPSYRTEAVDGSVIEKQPLFDLEDLEESVLNRFASATTIATFDTRANVAGPTATKTVFTQNAAEIYATEDSLYVFENARNHFRSGLVIRNFETQTMIWKFDFDSSGESIKLSAKGEVAGRLTTQFAADEHEGFLRVVTTGRTWSSGQDLFVLKQVGKQLKVVGQITGIAPNENLHSVRFLGDEAFLVTFRKVDPLFAVDLSDPTNPFIAGELKIPGFSDYLQPLGEGHLLGFGRGADEQMGRFQELQVSIFDVSDLDDPQLAHRYSFEGGRSTHSAATNDHHAVSYFPSEEILAIPIYSSNSRRGFFFGVDNTPILSGQESALQVFQVDTETGFESLAMIRHESRIMRSLRIGEQLIVVSNDQVTIHDLDNPSDQRSELDLQIGSGTRSVELEAYVPPESLTGLLNSENSADSSTTVGGGKGNARQPFVPKGRAAYDPGRTDYAPASTSRYAVRDIATEQLSFAVLDDLADELSLDLAVRLGE